LIGGGGGERAFCNEGDFPGGAHLFVERDEGASKSLRWCRFVLPALIERGLQMTVRTHSRSSAGKQTYTSLSDFEATLIALDEQMGAAREITFVAKGRLLTASHQLPPTGEAHYHLTYNLRKDAAEITASVDASSQTPLQFHPSRHLHDPAKQ